jgi:hypothetical protein
MKTDINKLIDAETAGYIDTGVDNDDAMRIILVPRYRVEWEYRENAEPEPETEYFNTYLDAIADAEEPGDFNLVDKYYEPVKRVKIFFNKGHLDENEVQIDEEDVSFFDIEFNLIPKYIVNLIQGHDGEIYSVEYLNPSESIYELLNEVSDTINDDIIGEYDDFTIEIPFKGKYRDINIYKGDDLAGSIRLRIADHPYNPNNNVCEGKFISVEIFNNCKTHNCFNGSCSLQFSGSDSYEDIVDAINEKVKHIIKNEF